MGKKSSKKVLTEKDVCIVTATYNRPEEVDRTLSMILKNKNIPGKILVIDQTKDNRTKEVVEKYKKNLPVKFIHSSQPSSSIAKNMGINEAKKNFEIILVLDDDVDLLKDYLKELLNEFNSHPELIGLGGIDTKISEEKYNKIANFLLKLFFLPHVEDHKYRVNGPYGNTTSNKIARAIRDAEWLPGFNECFRSSVFKNYKMPESIGYNVLEDIDSSYYIFKKYGKGSLVITPKCRAYHRYSSTARYGEKKRIFVNHQDHFYFYYVYLNNLAGTLKLIWSLTGIIIGGILRTIFKPSKRNFLHMKYTLQAIVYCIKNKSDIKKGKLRKFLNSDLTMKDS